MTLTTLGTPFDIHDGQRPHTYVVDDQIVHVWFEAESPDIFTYGERMYFAVLDKDGNVVQPRTSLGDHLDLDTQTSGFGQNVYHVSSDADGNLVFHVSEFVNGYDDDGTFVPYDEARYTITQKPNGNLGDPVEVADGYVTYELSDSATLSNGRIAVLAEDAITKTVSLEILKPNGKVITTTPVEGSFDDQGIFAQGAAGLEVLEVNGQILTLYRNPLDNTLYGQFFELNGTPTGGGEFQISQDGHMGASNAAVWEDGIIDAAELEDGRVAVVWADDIGQGDGTDVWLTILNPDGSVAVFEQRANENKVSGEQFHPRVYALESGGFIVTFDENNVPANEPRGFAQEFDANGARTGDLLELGAGTAGNGATGYGHIYPDGTGFMIDGQGNVQEITNGTSSGGGDPAPINGGKGDDTLSGSAEADEINGKKGNDLLKGDDGKDTLSGGDGADTLKGGNQNDKLQGDKGKDALNGGKGKDKLKGGEGNDTLDGGKGNDVLTGGKGADTFEFNLGYGEDRITDFADDKDVLMLDEDLWGGGLKKQKVLNKFASVDGDDIVFDFGDDVLRIEDFTDIDALKNDMVFV